MGNKVRNMLTSKFTIFAVLILVCSLHSIDAANCRIPGPGRIPTVAGGGAKGDIYSIMGQADQDCTAPCVACGQTGATTARADSDVAGITGGTGGSAGVNGCPTMPQLGAEICPTIQFTTADATAASESFFASVTGQALSAQSTEGSTTSSLINTGVTSVQTQAGLVDNNNAARLNLCPCQGSVTTTCPICGCADFGMPTSAPTAIPTTAPTAASSTTGVSEAINVSASGDDNLSGGAIAGIVIGSVVGAALVIGAGVMIGSK